MPPLKPTLYVIAAFQLVLGAAFLVVPGLTARTLGLEPAAPDWVHWLFAMMAARFLGYAYGMVWAARHLDHAQPWIDSMAAIQAVDWIATIAALSAGAVTITQVTSAAFVPVVYIAVVLWHHPNRRRRQAVPSGAA